MTATPEHLRTYLADTDAPCPSCDYNLRGLTSDTCPECNQRLTLRVGLAEPRQRAFIGALVGLAMGAGFQGLLMAYFIIMALWGGYSRSEWRYILLTAPFAVAEGLALLALVRWRRPFQRRSDTFKGWMVALAWLATLAGFVTFTVLIK
jgi:hypothetical protein